MYKYITAGDDTSLILLLKTHLKKHTCDLLNQNINILDQM